MRFTVFELDTTAPWHRRIYHSTPTRSTRSLWGTPRARPQARGQSSKRSWCVLLLLAQGLFWAGCVANGGLSGRLCHGGNVENSCLKNRFSEQVLEGSICYVAGIANGPPQNLIFRKWGFEPVRLLCGWHSKSPSKNPVFVQQHLRIFMVAFAVPVA